MNLTDAWGKSGAVMVGDGFFAKSASVDWSCGSCGALLLEDVDHVKSWEFRVDGACYLNGELAHQCPKGYSRGQSLVVAVTDHRPDRT